VERLQASEKILDFSLLSPDLIFNESFERIAIFILANLSMQQLAYTGSAFLPTTGLTPLAPTRFAQVQPLNVHCTAAHHLH